MLESVLSRTNVAIGHSNELNARSSLEILLATTLVLKNLVS